MFDHIAAWALAGCIVLAASPGSIAQTAAPGVLAPGPYEARLDKLLADADFVGLARAALRADAEQEALPRTLNWLRVQQLAHGGSTFLALLDASLAWRAAEQAAQRDRQALAQRAGTSLFAARLMILSEGFQCADSRAPDPKLSSADDLAPDVARYIASASEPDRRLMIKAAFDGVLGTFHNRANDIWLCGAGAARQTVASGWPASPVERPADPAIAPAFVPFKDWKAERRAVLDRLAEGSGLEPPSDYGDAQTRLK